MENAKNIQSKFERFDSQSNEQSKQCYQSSTWWLTMIRKIFPSASRRNSSCHIRWQSFYGAFRDTRTASSRYRLINTRNVMWLFRGQPAGEQVKKMRPCFPLIYGLPPCRCSTGPHSVSYSSSFFFLSSLRNNTRYNSGKFNQSLFTIIYQLITLVNW